MKHTLILFFIFHSFTVLGQSSIDQEIDLEVKKIKSMYSLPPKERGRWLKDDFQKLGEDIKKFINDGYVNEGMAATIHYGNIANILHMADIYSLSKEEFGAVAATIVGFRINMEQVRKGKMKVVDGKFVEVRPTP